MATLDQLPVGDWIAREVAALNPRSNIDDLFAALAAAGPLIRHVPQAHRRHTFTVGAIDRGRTIIGMVSNFQSLYSPVVSSRVESDLRISVQRPRSPRVVVAGAVQAVLPSESQALQRLLRAGVSEDRLLTTLRDLNERAASRSSMISRGCSVASTSHTGQGRVRPSLTDEQTGDFIPPEIAELLRRTGFEIHRATDSAGNPMPLRVVEYLPTVMPLQSDASFRRELRRNPTNSELWNKYGAFLAQRGDKSEAESAYRRALELAPDWLLPRQNLAGLLSALPGREQEARDSYENLLQRADTPTHVRSDYAVFVERTGDAEAALKAHEQAALAGDWPTAQARYATFLWRQLGQHELAAGLYTQATAVPQPDAETLLSAAQFQWQAVGDTDAAEELFVRAFGVDPEHSWALRNYADFLVLRRDDPSSALDYYRRALRGANPPSSELVGNYGFALLLAGVRPERALGHLRKAADLAPDSANTRVNLALGLCLAGTIESGARELEALAQRPDLNPIEMLELHALRALFSPASKTQEEATTCANALHQEGYDLPALLAQLLQRSCRDQRQQALIARWTPRSP